MRTVTHPLWQTRTRVPNGNVRCAAVIAEQFSRSLCNDRKDVPSTVDARIPTQLSIVISARMTALPDRHHTTTM
jgi:hypothetical protein